MCIRDRANVDKALGDKIREYKLDGVMVDEDYTRYYPYKTLASKVLGFTGGDNQGIIGLEVQYDAYLQGIEGTILTTTDARGIEVENTSEGRVEPIPGSDLYISLDYTCLLYTSSLYLVLILPIMALLSASACCAVLQWLCMKPRCV